MQSLQAFILLAALVTCCVTTVVEHSACVDHSIPESLQNETVSNLLKKYKDYLMTTNATMAGCKEITVFDILSHAVNATGDLTETMNKLGSRNDCAPYLEFTLKEVAFQNLKDPESFPGNTTVNELLNILMTNTTETVLKDVHAVIKVSFQNKTDIVNKTIHELIEMGHYSDQSRFDHIMLFAINASNVEEAAMELRFPRDLLDFSMIEMVDLLYTNVSSFQKDLSLKCAIRHLQSSKNWLMKLRQFRRQGRLKVQNKTVDDLFKESGLNKTTTTLYDLFRIMFNVQVDNVTFWASYGPRRVALEDFRFRVLDFAKIAFRDSGVILNSTVSQMFDLVFAYSLIFSQYKMNIAQSKSRKELILKRYNVTMDDLEKPPFNLTPSEIMSLSDRETENRAIQIYFIKYAEHENVTLGKLEEWSIIPAGQLLNATVDNFIPLLFKVAKAKLLRVLRKGNAFHKIIINTSSISFLNLKEQIAEEWQPLTTNLKGLVKLKLTYLIFQVNGLNPTKVCNTNFYDFVENHFLPKNTTFKDLLEIFGLHQNLTLLEREFKKFTFCNFNEFIVLRKFEILSWTVEEFVKKISRAILTNIDECISRKPCAKISGVTCKDNPFGFTCICPKNKTLDANRLCVDINECRQRPRPNCRNNSHCLNTVGSYKCRCNPGFKDVNNTCEDINECTENTHECNPRATCNNTVGSYSCSCNKGFTGNGYRCQDIDECDMGNVTCRNNSECKNTIGSYKCQCKRGFKDDVNNTCTDINECKLNPKACFSHSERNVNCTNTIGSYRCACKRGYRYVRHQRSCVDINECEEQRPCRSFANSMCNSTGDYSYECVCRPGFEKNPKNGSLLINCTDIDECVVGSHKCHKHATCKNKDGGYSCICEKGYKGSGFSCKVERLFDVSPSGLEIKKLKGFDDKIKPPLKFYYNEKMHKKFYITEDGYLAVGRRIKSSPRQLKLLNLDIISIFWAWTNYRYDTSNVTYYELSQSDDNAASILSRINKLVINSTNEANFDTQWAMVITWSNMSPYWYLRRIFYKSPYSKETNTFQVVIAVAGRKTVVIFLYEHGGMTWKRGQLRKATVGFSFKKRRNGYQVDGSFNDDILNIDEQTFTDPSGKKRQGIIVRVFKDAKPDVSPEENCLNWILKENKKNQGWLNRLIECPSTERQFWIMRWLFRRMTNIRDRTCYITRRRDKSCCYDTDSGALITSPYIKAGRALGPNDGNAFNWCCIESKRYCESFSQLRPADSDEQRECRGFCSWLRNIWTIRIRRTRRIRRRPFRRGFMWGDPHITTLDGFKYTFNGLGEYVLLKTTDSEDFNAIHARTKRSKNKDGSLAKATVFSGFAMRSSKNTTVQVLLDGNMAGNLSITTVNKSMNCQPFGIADIDEHPIEGFTLSNNSNALVVVYDSGLTVEITPGMDLLQFGLSIPTSNFENRTEGLLGKLNEDPNDDLFLRNGTAVPLNSTEKEIFEYGKTWVVQDDERLFVNSSCDKLPVYVDVNFRPLFLSDVQNNITAEMRETCKNNTECLLDYFVTGNKAFAQATLKFEEENEKVKKILDNRPPSITLSPEVIRVTAGQMIKINVTVTDLDNDPITKLMVNGLPAQGAVFTNTTPTGVLTWTPPVNLTTLTVTFVATDSKGAATTSSPSILYCDCKNNNTCNFETIEETYANSSVQLVGCNCTDQYTGDQCETEVNPCDEGACYDNVTCTVIRNPFGRRCGPCPAGLEGDGIVCNDFDECINSSRNNCTEMSENCVNTIGSFRCDCKPGYVRNAKTKKCDDVNECNSQFADNYKCKTNTDCKNTNGSYSCSCKKGFKGDPLVGCSDIDECNGADRICFGLCENSVGSFNCSCSAGYKLNTENKTLLSCEDIDECKFSTDNNCDQVCVDNEGSYNCTCKSGFKLGNDGSSCVVKTENKCDSTNGGCERLCTNSSGTVTCHCPRGFNLSSDGKSCMDVNECLTSNGGCSQNCTNYDGSYNCSCRSGYKLKGARMCEDINECMTNNGGCSQMCHNKPGGHDCKCKKGYTLKASDKKTCEDINECDNNAHSCGQYRVCNNAPGGYKCSCKDRRMFSNGGAKCKRSRRFRFYFILVRIIWINDYSDEHSEKSAALVKEIVRVLDVFFRFKFQGRFLGCRVMKFSQGSVKVNVTLNFDSNSTVTANDIQKSVANVSDIGGLKIDPTKSAVSDLDECSDPSLSNCHKDATCKNEPGSFSCSCNNGYKGDGFTCEAIPKTKDKDDDKKIMIILLSTLIPLAVIIIIILIVCCCRRRGKGNLKMEESSSGYQMSNRSNMYESSRVQKEVRHGSERRGSDDSINAAYYDNVGSKKQSSSGMYDVSQAQYYDNPAVST